MNSTFDALSTYRITILGVVLAVVLMCGLVLLLGGTTEAAPFLTLAGTVVLPVLLALLRADQAANKVDQVNVLRQEQHVENQLALQKLVMDNVSLGRALKAIAASSDPIASSSDPTVKQAAETMATPPDASPGGTH